MKIAPSKPAASVKLSDFLAKFDDLSEEHDGWLAHCPAHKDSHHSLRITVSEQTGKVLVKDRAGCSSAKVMRAVGLTLKDLAAMETDLENAHTTASTDALPDAPTLADLALKLDGYAAALQTPAGGQALAYAAQRFGVEPDDARRLGLGFSSDKGGPRLVVPFRDLSGQALGFQARSLLNTAQIRWAGPANPEGASWADVGYFPGSSGWPEVIICEGPGDALTAMATGYDSIGIRGAGLAGSDATLDQLEEMLQNRIAIVAGDGDVAGRQFSAELAERLIARGIQTKVLPMPDGKDITDWRADDPAWFRQGFVKKIKELGNTTKEQARMGGWDEEVYSLSDIGGARYLRDLLDSQGKSIRSTAATGFLQLENGIWTQKADTQIRTLSHLVGDRLRGFAHASREHAINTKSKADIDRANRFAAYRDHAQSSRGIDSILKELKSVEGVHADIADFDRYPYYLAVRNGVVDLRSGKLLPHDPAYLLTKRIDVDYDETADAPRWRQFLNEVFPGQPDMPAYIQRLVGYGITGSTDEQAFAVLYGTGSNGKSIFTDTLTEVFRAITTTTPFSTFEQKASGGIPNDLAALVGARLVMASEGEQGKRMAEAVLKRITGRDDVSARFLNREFFSFKPQFLLFMASNYRPAFMGQDDGLWRRVKLIEFRRQFKANERDPRLADKLLAESPGILAWAVAGAVQWYANGLAEPASVTEVTQNYKTNSDVLNGFLPGIYEKGEDEDWVSRTELFSEFQDYAEEGNFRDLSGWSSRAFYRAIEERGYPAGKRNGVVGFKKVRKSKDPHAAEQVPEHATMEVSTAPTALSGPSLENFNV